MSNVRFFKYFTITIQKPYANAHTLMYTSMHSLPNRVLYLQKIFLKHTTGGLYFLFVLYCDESVFDFLNFFLFFFIVFLLLLNHCSKIVVLFIALLWSSLFSLLFLFFFFLLCHSSLLFCLALSVFVVVE